MNRSGYSDDIDHWELIKWRGMVASAIRGKRGQRLLIDLIAALDAMPEKRLIADQLECDGEVCALGSVGRSRQIDMTGIDPHDPDTVSGLFDIAACLAHIHPSTYDEQVAPAVGATQSGGNNQSSGPRCLRASWR